MDRILEKPGAINIPPALRRWLDEATHGLAAYAAARIERDIRDHYDQAVQEAVEAGLPEQQAAQNAVESLGNASSARHAFSRIYPDEYHANEIGCFLRQFQRPKIFGWSFLAIVVLGAITFSAITHLYTTNGYARSIEDPLSYFVRVPVDFSTMSQEETEKAIAINRERYADSVMFLKDVSQPMAVWAVFGTVLCFAAAFLSLLAVWAILGPYWVRKRQVRRLIFSVWSVGNLFFVGFTAVFWDMLQSIVPRSMWQWMCLPMLITLVTLAYMRARRCAPVVMERDVMEAIMEYQPRSRLSYSPKYLQQHRETWRAFWANRTP